MKMYSKEEDCIVDAWLFDGTRESIREAQRFYPAIRLVRSTQDHDVVYAEFQAHIGRARARPGQFLVKMPNGYLVARGPKSLRPLSTKEKK